MSMTPLSRSEKFRDLNGRAVRNFTLEVPQQLFADDLRHDLPLRLVRRHIIREQERAVGRVAGALPQQVRDTVTELRGHRNDGVELKFCGIGRDDGKQILLLDRVDLVDNKDDRRMRGAELAEQLFLLRADVRDGLDEQQRGIHIGDGVVHDIVHIVAEARARLMEARRVDEHELRVIVRDDAADAVARRLRLMGNNGDLFRQRGG